LRTWFEGRWVYRTVTDGQPLYLIETPDGNYLLTPYDPAFANKISKADDIIDRYRNTLHVLSK
jgi:hypothetical protein